MQIRDFIKTIFQKNMLNVWSVLNFIEKTLQNAGLV